MWPSVSLWNIGISSEKWRVSKPAITSNVCCIVRFQHRDKLDELTESAGTLYEETWRVAGAEKGAEATLGGF